MSDAYEIVKEAIQKKLVIKAIYQRRPREMCPHVIGRNKEGERQALFYQFGGTSSRGLGPLGSKDNWRCIKIAHLREVTSEPGEWRTAPNHSRPQECVDRIDIEVDY